MSQRVGLRLLQAFRPTFQTYARAPLRRKLGLRYQTTEAAPATPAKETLAQRFWNSPIGVKTVHFWAPVMKWCLVLTEVSDFARPAESLSLTQNAALTATGAIWTRWCLIIKPKNVLLAAVNFFLFCVGTVQLSRIAVYNSSQKGSAKEAVKSKAEEEKDAVKGAVKEAEGKVKQAVS